MLTLLVTGCEKGWSIFGGPFVDNHLFLNTKLDHKLEYEISTHCSCFNDPPKYILDKSEIERCKSSRIRIFQELFPPETQTTTVVDTLKDSGAQCQTEKNNEYILIHCSLTKEYIYGIRELYLSGWQTGRAYLHKSSFEYLLTTQAESILNVSVNILGCELYELDKDLYDETKTIKPIRVFDKW
jgi:hypothetical protein